MHFVRRTAAAVIAAALLAVAGCGSDEPAESTPTPTWSATATTAPPATTEPATAEPTPSEPPTVQAGQSGEQSFPISGSNPSSNSATSIVLPELRELWTLTYTYDCTKAKTAGDKRLRVWVGHYSWIVYDYDKQRGSRKVTKNDIGEDNPERVLFQGPCRFTLDVPAKLMPGKQTGIVTRPLPANHTVMTAEGTGTGDAEMVNLPPLPGNPLVFKYETKSTCGGGMVQFENDPVITLGSKGTAEYRLDGPDEAKQVEVRTDCAWTVKVVTEAAGGKLI